MKLKHALACLLAIVIATTTLSAQAPRRDASAQPPRLNMKLTGDLPSLPREAVAPMTRQQTQGKSVWPTVAGAAIGGVVGVYSGMGILLSDVQCQPNCGPRIRAGFALIIGGPIVGGLIGYWIGKR